MESQVYRPSAVLEERKSTNEDVEKILKLVASEDEDLNSEGISLLVSSIRNFFRSHQTLEGRHDELTRELNDSSHHRSKMNGEFATTVDISPSPSNLDSNEFSKAKREFQIERESLSATIAEREAAIAGLEDELQKAKERIANIEVENGEPRRTLENRKQGNEAPISTSIQEAVKSMTELKLERNVLKDEKVSLCMHNAELQMQLDKLNKLLKVREEEQKSSADEKCVAIAKMQRVGSEKSALEAVVEDLKGEVSTLKRSISDVRSRNSELEADLEERRREVLQLRKQHGEAMQLTTQMVSRANLMIEKLKGDLTSKIATQEKVLSDQKDALGGLTRCYSEAKNEMARKLREELEAKVERICQLEIIVGERKRQMQNLEEKHHEALGKLKASTEGKANTDKEIARLNELVQTLEVHLRLLDRKLKITKSEFKEKDEMYRRKVKELQQKCSQLEEHCDSLYEEICYREKESEEVKEAVATGMSRLVGDFRSFESAIEESCGRLQTRLSGCLEGVAKGGFGLGNPEDRHEEEEEEAERVRVMEEEANRLREEVGRMARACEERVEELEREARGKEEEGRRRVVELERRLEEREEEARAKDEEKREAIRQLCVLIEYHRENFDGLLRSLPANGAPIGPSA